MGKEKKVLSLSNKMRLRGRLLVLISFNPAQRSSWALTSCPDRGRPTLHGWWPPVALRYIERWRPTALSTRFTVSRHTHQQTQSDLVRGAASDGKLHCRLHRRLCTTTALRLTSTPSPRHRRPGPHHLRHGYVELFLQARGWSVTSHLPFSLSL